jgi:hypothetical protein
VLGATEPRLSAVPRRDQEHVILRLPMLDRLRLRQNGDLVEGTRRDSYFLFKFSNESGGGRLVTFAVSADDVPDSWIGRPIR